jgi:hypothetical protein
MAAFVQSAMLSSRLVAPRNLLTCRRAAAAFQPACAQAAPPAPLPDLPRHKKYFCLTRSPMGRMQPRAAAAGPRSRRWPGRTAGARFAGRRPPTIPRCPCGRRARRHVLRRAATCSRRDPAPGLQRPSRGATMTPPRATRVPRSPRPGRTSRRCRRVCALPWTGRERPWMRTEGQQASSHGAGNGRKRHCP